MLRVVAFVALSIAAASFAATTYITSDTNWEPVQLPLPGPGLEVASLFEIATAGTFRLEAQVPMQASERDQLLGPNPLRVPSRLEVTVEGPGGFTLQRAINELVGGGAFVWGNIGYYSSESFDLPTSGEYKIHLANRGETTVFGERGAMVALTRYQHSTEAYLKSSFLRGLGWVALVCGVLAALWSEARGFAREKNDHVA